MKDDFGLGNSSRMFILCSTYIFRFLSASGRILPLIDPNQCQAQPDFEPDPCAKHAGLLESKRNSVIRSQKQVYTQALSPSLLVCHRFPHSTKAQ